MIHKQLKFLNLLYLEDNKEVRENTTDTISLFVKRVFSASSVNEALDIYDNNKIDIIISDIDMPGLNGLDFISKVRDIDKDIPIVVITAYKTEEFLYKAVTLHLEDYLIKPVSYLQLKEILINCLKKIDCSKKLNIIFENGYIYNITSEILKNNQHEVCLLPNKEKLLLNLLIENQNEITYYDEIEHYIWEGEDLKKDRLKVLIGKLRKKIGTNHIINEHQLGYRLVF